MFSLNSSLGTVRVTDWPFSIPVAFVTCIRICVIVPSGTLADPKICAVFVSWMMSMVVVVFTTVLHSPVRLRAPDLWTVTESTVTKRLVKLQPPAQPFPVPVTSEGVALNWTSTVPFAGSTLAGLNCTATTSVPAMTRPRRLNRSILRKAGSNCIFMWKYPGPTHNSTVLNGKRISWCIWMCQGRCLQVFTLSNQKIAEPPPPKKSPSKAVRSQ